MVDDLKYYDGSVQQIERVPVELKELYRTAFEIEGGLLSAPVGARSGLICRRWP
jgi:hypothetical protein